jgi:hypothetical protein
MGKKVKFNRKPVMNRAKTYKLKTPKKSDYIEKIQGVIDNIGFTTAADMQLDSSPVHQAINKNHIALIERFSRETATVVIYVHEMEVDTQEISYEDISNENLELISNLLAEYAIQKEECC